jgi:hypothetical protein
LHVALLYQRTGKVYMSFDKTRFQANRCFQLRDCGVNLSLRQQYPSQQIVGLRVPGVQLYRILEILLSGGQIASLNGCDSSPVRRGFPSRTLRRHSCAGTNARNYQQSTPEQEAAEAILSGHVFYKPRRKLIQNITTPERLAALRLA